MFSSFVTEYLTQESDIVIDRAGIDSNVARAEASNLLAARTNDKFFENLANLGNTVEDEAANKRDKAIAQVALLHSPLMYPNSKVRCVAGVAYALYATQKVYLPCEWNHWLDGHRLYFGTDLSRAIPGFDPNTVAPRYGSDKKEQGFDYDSPGIGDRMFEGYFAVAGLLHVHGLNALNTLRDRFNVRNPGRYPLDILLGQLGKSEPDMPEIPILVESHDHNGTLYKDSVYDSVRDAANNPKLPAIPTIREFDSGEELIDQMLAASDPIVGVINAHGNWGCIGEIEDDFIDSISKSQLMQLRKNWHESGGIALLSCHAASPAEDDDPCVAIALANVVGKPVAASDDEVWKTSVERRVGKTDNWTFNFHTHPGGEKIATIERPARHLRSKRSVAITARTIYDESLAPTDNPIWQDVMNS